VVALNLGLGVLLIWLKLLVGHSSALPPWHRPTARSARRGR
jgi:hypothetical protein